MENKENELGQDLFKIFDNFIKTGVVVEEKEVVNGMKIKLKVLNISEQLEAESSISTERVAADVVAKVRGASILSQAILSINGSDIEKENLTKEEVRTRRFVLYKQLLSLPSIVIQKMYEFYIDCLKKQEDIYVNFDKTVDDIKNF